MVLGLSSWEPAKVGGQRPTQDHSVVTLLLRVFTRSWLGDTGGGVCMLTCTSTVGHALPVLRTEVEGDELDHH